MSRGQWGGAFPVYKHCSGIYPESWRRLPDNVLVTFTWPGDLPQKAVWGTLSGQVASKAVHLAGKNSKYCLKDTCGGGAAGQVNVT